MTAHLPTLVLLLLLAFSATGDSRLLDDAAEVLFTPATPPLGKSCKQASAAGIDYADDNLTVRASTRV